jgi:hypothetical protein
MNLHLEIDQTLDWETVWAIVHDASVFDRVCDDHWTRKPLRELRDIVRGIVENPHNHALLVTDAGRPVGCFLCYAQGKGLFEIHTMLTDRCRGADAIQAGRMGTRLMLSLPDVEKLVSFCPANMPEVYLFARFCGWHKDGIAAAKWLKNGVEYAMRIVEATKHDLQELPCL